MGSRATGSRRDQPASTARVCPWSYLAGISEAAVSPGPGDGRRSEHMNAAGRNSTKSRQQTGMKEED